MRRRILVAALLIIVTAALASTVLFVPDISVHDQDAVGFGASLSAVTVAQGQDITVRLADWNTLDFKNAMPAAAGSTPVNLTSGPCGWSFPGGIAVYRGAYSLNNISSVTPLPFYAPAGVYLGCPPDTFNPFTFGPLQNISASISLAGYYASGYTPAYGGGSTLGILDPYAPGIYTVIAGDPVGHIKVMYFRVTAPSSGTQERTGPISTFPASWLGPCNTSATGNVTTGVYLDLNSTAALDNIDLNTVYAQILNSSAFQYDMVGRGWVVSSWAEIDAPDSTGSQVVVAFIVTTNGVPSGDVFAYYSPASGVTYTSPLSIQTTSCST